MRERFAAEERDALDAVKRRSGVHLLQDILHGRASAAVEWEHLRVAAAWAPEGTTLEPEGEAATGTFGRRAGNDLCQGECRVHDFSLMAEASGGMMEIGGVLPWRRRGRLYNRRLAFAGERGSDVQRPPLPSGVASREPVMLFDGVCNLCNGFVQLLIRLDRHARLKLAALQSPAGQALLAWCGMPLVEFNTIVLIEERKAYFKSTAILRITRHLPWPWPLASLAIAIPNRLRDMAYDLVAQNRYRLFGKKESCMVPTPALRRRFLSMSD
jgi:predicted DCC family thiol-disulfide oxidoreductase YuxK